MIKNYPKDLLNLFTSIHSYPEILKKSGWKTLGFFLLSMILISLVMSYRLTQVTFPELLTTVEESIDQLPEHYPDDLEINWDGQKLLVNPEQELAIPYPDFLKSENLEVPENLALYQPLEGDQKPTNANALFIFTTANFFINNNTNDWTELPLKDLPFLEKPLTITKESLPENTIGVKSYLAQTAQDSKPVIFLVSPLVLVVSTLWSGFFDMLLAFVATKLTSFKLSFKKIIKLSFHIFVVAAAVDQVALLFYKELAVPLFSLTYWAIFLYALYANRKRFG